MSKVALVIEKPQRCEECPCLDIRTLYDICRAKRQAKSFEEQNVVPEWCPLQKLPEKQEDLPTNIYRDGWNACIDTILKGGE